MDIVTTQTTGLRSMLGKVVPVTQLIMSVVMNANGFHLPSSMRESGAAANHLVSSRHAYKGNYIVQGVIGALSERNGEHTERFDLRMLDSSEVMRRASEIKPVPDAALEQGAQTKSFRMALSRPSLMRLAQALLAADIELPRPSRGFSPALGRTFRSVPYEMMPERAIERAAWAVAQSTQRRSDANGGGGSWSDGRTVIRLRFWHKVIGARCRRGTKRSFGHAKQHNRYFPVGGSTCQRKAVLG